MHNWTASEWNTLKHELYWANCSFGTLVISRFSALSNTVVWLGWTFYSRYGDPHFSIAPPAALPLCFDIHPHENVAQLNFLMDPVSSLQVTGKTEPAVDHPGKTFITEIMVNSPEGIRVQFGQAGVILLKADGTQEKLEGRGTVGDVSYVVCF